VSCKWSDLVLEQGEGSSIFVSNGRSWALGYRGVTGRRYMLFKKIYKLPLMITNIGFAVGSVINERTITNIKS